MRNIRNPKPKALLRAMGECLLLDVNNLCGFGSGGLLNPTWSFSTGTRTTGYLMVSPRNVEYPASASITAGDLLLIAVRLGAARTGVTASGFTTQATMGGYQWFLTKIATGSESGSVSVSWSGGTADFSAQMIRIRPSVGTPRLYAQNTGAYTDPCVANQPAKLGNDLTLCFDSAYTDGSTLTSSPSGFTTLTYESTPGPTWYSGYHANHLGATITTDWTMSSSSLNCTITVEP